MSLRPAVGAVVATEFAALAALTAAPLWAAAIITVFMLALCGVTVSRRAAPGWIMTWLRWRRDRRKPTQIPPAVDVTLGDTVCGVRVGTREAVAVIAVHGRPNQPTYLRPHMTVTADTLPLGLLAEQLEQPGGITLSMDVVSSGRRVRRSDGYPALYSTLLAGRAAVGQRTTHLIVRLPIGASSTGLGYRQSVGAALTAAVERIVSALRQDECRAAVLGAAECDGLLAETSLGLFEKSDRRPKPLLGWCAVKTRDGYTTTYHLDDIAALERVWALNADVVATSVSLHAHTGQFHASAAVLMRTAQPAPQPPLLCLRRQPGDQFRALTPFVPAQLQSLKLPTQLIDPERLAFPVGGCGVLIGAALRDEGCVRRDDFVTLPLTDPTATTRISIQADDTYIRALLIRAAAIGERIAIHTDTPQRWAKLVDPNICIVGWGQAMFAPDIVVDDHATYTPAQGFASTMISLGDTGDADIAITQDGDTVHVTTQTGSVDVAPIRFLREDTWTADN